MVTKEEPKYTSLDSQSDVNQEISIASTRRGLTPKTTAYWIPMSHQVPMPRRDLVCSDYPSNKELILLCTKVDPGT